MAGFWIATVLTMGGTLLSFYAERIAWHGAPRHPHAAPIPHADDSAES